MIFLIRLAGYSFGGNLAYAIAARFLELGADVGFVGIIDSICQAAKVESAAVQVGHRPLSEADRRELRISLLLSRAAKVAGPTARTDLELLRARLDRLEFGKALAECRARGWMAPQYAAMSDREIFDAFDARVAHTEALMGYVEPPLPITIHLFRSQERGGNLDDGTSTVNGRHRGWERVLPRERIEVISVPGNHRSLGKGSNGAVLGRRLSDVLVSLRRDETSQVRRPTGLVR